jgi:hypothetical protein
MTNINKKLGEIQMNCEPRRNVGNGVFLGALNVENPFGIWVPYKWASLMENHVAFRGK